MPGKGTDTDDELRIGGSFTLVGGAATVVAPGIAAAGSGTSATRVDSSSQDWRCGCAAVSPGRGTAPEGDDVTAAGFTGKTFWQVGHLMRAPPAGIFLSSMFRTELQDGHETFMGAGGY
jgi:hypothetical protein